MIKLQPFKYYISKCYSQRQPISRFVGALFSKSVGLKNSGFYFKGRVFTNFIATCHIYSLCYYCSVCNTNEIGDRIHTTIIDNAEADVPYSYEAKDNTIKIKVYLKQGNWSRWVQQVYYLDKGNNIDIIITGNTLVGNYEP
jgi:hypothetical protein